MRKMIVVTIAFFVLALNLTAVVPSLADEYVDVEQSSGPGSIVGSMNWQQTFVPEASNITAVSVYLKYSTGSVTVKITDSVCGTVTNIGTGTGQGWTKCDLLGAHALVPGNTYVIEVTATGANMAFSDANPYADGSLLLDCEEFMGSQGDLKFRTWADPNAVPTEKSSWGSAKAIYQ